MLRWFLSGASCDRPPARITGVSWGWGYPALYSRRVDQRGIQTDVWWTFTNICIATVPCCCTYRRTWARLSNLFAKTRDVKSNFVKMAFFSSLAALTSLFSRRATQAVAWYGCCASSKRFRVSPRASHECGLSSTSSFFSTFSAACSETKLTACAHPPNCACPKTTSASTFSDFTAYSIAAHVPCARRSNTR